jgi:hypothetical protein
MDTRTGALPPQGADETIAVPASRTAGPRHGTY